jgi:hypothetical protein
MGNCCGSDNTSKKREMPKKDSRKSKNVSKTATNTPTPGSSAAERLKAYEIISVIGEGG